MDHIYNYLSHLYNIIYPPPSYFTFDCLDQIDFDITSTSDIVNFLNTLKSTHTFKIENYENMYETSIATPLTKLKYVIVLCLESKHDTSDLMMKHIMKYKGDLQYKNIKPKKVFKPIVLPAHPVDNEIIDLEKRFQLLISEENNNDDDNDNTIKNKIPVIA